MIIVLKKYETKLKYSGLKMKHLKIFPKYFFLRILVRPLHRTSVSHKEALSGAGLVVFRVMGIAETRLSAQR